MCFPHTTNFFRQASAAVNAAGERRCRSTKRRAGIEPCYVARVKRVRTIVDRCDATRNVDDYDSNMGGGAKKLRVRGRRQGVDLPRRRRDAGRRRSNEAGTERRKEQAEDGPSRRVEEADRYRCRAMMHSGLDPAISESFYASLRVNPSYAFFLPARRRRPTKWPTI